MRGSTAQLSLPENKADIHDIAANQVYMTSQHIRCGIAAGALKRFFSFNPVNDGFMQGESRSE
jgi:hypothetical protein